MFDKPLSPRHERSVLEYLKDGNATQAYLRAGYAPRSAQPQRLADAARIGAAVSAGRQHITQSLEVTDHRKGEQTVILKLGKLQALAALTKHVGLLVAKPAPGLTAEDWQRYEEECAGFRRLLDHREREQERLRQELRERGRRWRCQKPDA